MDSRSRDIQLPKTVLVAGTGRSGTTWLGKILDSSPRVFYRHQPDNRNRYPWFRDIPSRLDPTPEFARFRTPFAVALGETFRSHHISLDKRPSFRKDFLRWRPWQALNLSMRVCRKLCLGWAPMVRIPWFMFRGDPLDITFAFKSVISNMRLVWLHHHFPDIKIVLIVRHPGGYLNSILTGARDHGWSEAGSKKRLEGAVYPFVRPEHDQYTCTYEDGTGLERELVYWIVANETPILELKGSAAFKVVVYEELCARPIEVARQIFEFIEVPFTDATRAFLCESGSVDQEGYHSIYKNSMRSAYKWQSELTKEQQATIDKYLQGTTLKDLWSRSVTPGRKVERAL